MAYSLKHTGLGRGEDYEFRWEGRSVGRTYADVTPIGPNWYWSIYGTAYRGVLPADVSVQGRVADLAAAKDAFKANFEKLLAAGNVEQP